MSQHMICVVTGSVSLFISMATKFLTPEEYRPKHRHYGKHNTQRPKMDSAKVLPSENIDD